MNTNGKIKVIFFDLGQTLTELSLLQLCMLRSLGKHLRDLNIDYNKLTYDWVLETQQVFMEHRLGEFINMREIQFLSIKKTLKTNNISINDKQVHTLVEDVWQDLIKNSKFHPDVIPVLIQLKQSGYKLGIITDCDVDVANGVIQKHNLMNFFDVKVISGVIKAYKPNPIMFNEAIKLAKCSPDEGVYVGDSETDIKGANYVGLITVIINRNEIEEPKIGIRPDFSINSLTELPRLLSEINTTVM